MTPEPPSPADEGAGHRSEDISLSVRQRELLEELTALDPQLAGLYRRGLRLLPEIDDAGTVHVLGHVGRELTLGVVDAVLEEGWSLSERELAAIPNDERYRGKIAGSLGLDPSDRRVTQWFELHRVFVEAAHYRRGDPPPDPQKLRLSFERLEQLLYGRVGPYFQTQAELDELLAITQPTAGDVERLQSVLLRPQQRRYFFGRLTNSNWLRPLDRLEAFSTPPERLVHSDGSWQAVGWPEGEFLTRVAAEEPSLVVEILERLSSKNLNPGVWRVVTDVANAAPPDVGVRLVPQLSQAVGSTVTAIFADGLIKLVSRLADAGHEVAFDLAAALLFVPSATELGEVPRLTFRTDWLLPRLRWTQFSEFIELALPSLEGNNQLRTLALLLDKINQIAAVVRKLELRSLDSRARHRGRADSEDVAWQFVEATSDLVAKFASAGEENARQAFGMVAKYDAEVFTTLKYKLIAAAGEHLQEELDSLLSSTLAVEPDKWGREVALVVRQRYGNASAGARAVFRYALERGPDPETIRGMLNFHNISAPEPKDIENIKRSWQRRRLTWFRGDIPAELQQLAEGLGEWGVKPTIEDQELAEVGFYSGGVSWGEPSPFTAEDLGERSAPEIAKLITEWRPGETSLETGTARGFELSIQDLAASDSNKALDVWELTEKNLPRGHARSLLDGLLDALKRNTEDFDWTRSLALAGSAVEQAGSAASPVCEELLRSAMDLIEEGVTKSLVPRELEDEVWHTVKAAFRVVSTCDEDEVSFDSFEAVLMAALNRTASRMLRGALYAALWTYRLREPDSPAEAARHAEFYLAPMLDEVLKWVATRRAAAEAMIGQLLPQMQLIAPAWFEKHAAEMLDSGAIDPYMHPMWGAYITRGRLYDSTFNAFRPWYIRAAEAAGEDSGRTTSGGDWSLTRGLALHVSIAVLRGIAAVGDADSLVEKTFTRVPADDRGRSYWQIFRDWSDAEKSPPKEFVDRLLSFWEWRVEQLEQSIDHADTIEEAKDLGWFLRTPHLPPADVLRLGVRTTRIAKGKIEAHAGWERLRELAGIDPDLTYEITELVLEAQLSERQHYVDVSEVKPLLKVVIGSGNDATRARVRRMVNRLGEAGYTDIREVLD